MSNSTKDQLINLVGKTVTFTDEVDHWEIYAESGMKANVVKFYFDNRKTDAVHRIYVDFSPFENENHKRQNANWYDSDGNPCLTAVEAETYNPQEWIYLDNNSAEWPFKIDN